jgi:hypothetical protein
MADRLPLIERKEPTDEELVHLWVQCRKVYSGRQNGPGRPLNEVFHLCLRAIYREGYARAAQHSVAELFRDEFKEQTDLLSCQLSNAREERDAALIDLANLKQRWKAAGCPEPQSLWERLGRVFRP